MPGFRQWHAIACSLGFLLTAPPVQPTAADEPSNSVMAASSPIAPETLATNPVIKSRDSSEKRIVLALVKPVLQYSSLPERGNLVLASPAWPAPARFFTINQVLARHKSLASESSSVRLAKINPPVSNIPSLTIGPVRSDEPFGLFTFRAPKGALWEKWHKIQTDIKAEEPAIARCRSEAEHCSRGVARFTAIIKEAAARHGRVKLEFVNERVNGAIRYVPDMAQWGKPDVWSAPLDTNKQGSFDTGRGDCEDYAIAKYVALRDSGIPSKNLRLLLVRDNWAHMDHAVLAARDKGRWLILDNRWSRLIADTDLKQLEPLFALDGDGVELLAAPYAAKHRMPIETVSSVGQYFTADIGPISGSKPVTGGPIWIGSLQLPM